jgi:hypothetical protein
MGVREGGGGRRKRHYAVAGAALGCIVLGLSCVALMNGEDVPTVLRGVTTEGRKLYPKMQLWESADSPNHDPYYNIFDYHKDLKRDNRGGHVEDENAHKTWSPNEVKNMATASTFFTPPPQNFKSHAPCPSRFQARCKVMMMPPQCAPPTLTIGDARC